MICPLCQSPDKKRIYRLCSNMKILGANFPDQEAHIVSCENCGLVYSDSPATQKDYLTYYTTGAKAPKYYEMFGYDETTHYFQHILQVIGKYIGPGSKILDVAGSWGELAKYIAEQGYTDITMLDPCVNCAREAESKGLRTALTDSLEMGGFLREKYDMILFNHTLEHIVDLGKTMDNARGLLKDDGHIFIEVPDAEEYANQNLAPFYFLTYEHVLHMTSHDIENLANRHGFQVIAGEKYYKKVSEYPSVHAILKKVPGKAPVRYSSVGRNAVKRYLEKCEGSLRGITALYESSGEPLILWGLGASTAILLEAFGRCNVTALIDSNPMRQGLEFSFGGKCLAITDPAALKDDEGSIFILSIPYRASIEKQIRAMGLKNKIISFP